MRVNSLAIRSKCRARDLNIWREDKENKKKKKILKMKAASE